MARLAALVLALVCLAGPVFAVQPDEIMDDPVLEARARGLSAEMRCMVCQNESIDESNAPLARDLRLLIRERIAEGDSDDEVVDFVVARYGDFVLLRPPFNARTAALWLAPVLILMAGIVGLVAALRRRRNAPTTASAALSAEEQRALDDILRR